MVLLSGTPVWYSCVVLMCGTHFRCVRLRRVNIKEMIESIYVFFGYFCQNSMCDAHVWYSCVVLILVVCHLDVVIQKR